VSEPLRISFEPQNEGSAQHVVDGLIYFNIAQTGHDAWYPVRYYLRGEGDAIMGGLLGQIWGRWLHINILWVAQAARGRGHASELLRGAEAYARTHDCKGAYLETFTFQARPFYEKHGYAVFAEMDDYPPGHKQFFLKKMF
jgi:GNAT superfamily N-acetyltransferase